MPTVDPVSIHLMLLFIGAGLIALMSCCVVSIHLMLLFIGIAFNVYGRVTVVSIHLMLLFILDSKAGLHDVCMFQYISCYSLSGAGLIALMSCCVVSIHLMLLFILWESPILLLVSSFQYISCYSLSYRGPSSFSPFACFNTSHVTLYHHIHDFPIVRIRFQYISCYSLSLVL